MLTELLLFINDKNYTCGLIFGWWMCKLLPTLHSNPIPNLCVSELFLFSLSKREKEMLNVAFTRHLKIKGLITTIGQLLIENFMKVLKALLKNSVIIFPIKKF